VKKIKSIFLFPNGNIAAVDDKGQQIAEVQANLIVAWANMVATKGYDADGTILEGELGNMKLVKGGNGGWTLVAA